MEHLFGMDAIIEALIESLLIEYNLEIALAVLVLCFMALGVVLMTLSSIVAVLVIPVVYMYYLFAFLKSILIKFKKAIGK